MLRDELDMLAEYTPGSEVEARVLYITPTLNTSVTPTPVILTNYTNLSSSYYPAG